MGKIATFIIFTFLPCIENQCASMTNLYLFKNIHNAERYNDIIIIPTQYVNSL